MFFGKKALKVSLVMNFKKESILALGQQENLFEFYNQHYSYKIDRNMIIYAEDDVYLNIPKQMLDLVEDTKKILKFRKD